jgi:GNAT superfamily N-acetyltransferase
VPHSTLFRPAADADLPALVALLRDSYAADGQGFDEDQATRTISWMMRDPARGDVRVAQDESGLVGYLILTFGFSLEYGGVDAFVDELYFVPEKRGQGLGTRALALAEQVCRERGVRALHLTVDRPKVRARDLYLRSGFVEHDRLLMTKRLAATDT